MIQSNYIDAYRAVHRDAPTIEQRGNRYHVTTRSGSFTYSRAEIDALTRGLLHLANRNN